MGRVIAIESKRTPKMSLERAKDFATEEYSRSILEGLGLFMIAEAWGIQPYAVTQYGGYGALTEAYVIQEMSKIIRYLDLDDKSDDAALNPLSVIGTLR